MQALNDEIEILWKAQDATDNHSDRLRVLKILHYESRERYLQKSNSTLIKQLQQKKGDMIIKEENEKELLEQKQKYDEEIKTLKEEIQILRT